MTASSRGSRAASALLRSSRSQRPQAICADCLYTTRRSYAMAAESLKTLDASPDQALPHLKKTMPPVSSSPSAKYTTQAGILLSRAPLLTAPQTSFEKAFFFYQKRLNERLVMPFTRYFYFKKDTPADTDWKIKAKERNGTFARELGGYRAYGDEGWNDELLSSESVLGQQQGAEMGKMGLSEPKWIVESLVKDAKVRAVEGKDGNAVAVEEGMEDAKDLVVEKPMSRFSEADRTKDEKRLDRQMSRTLYLLVKKEGRWMFPCGDLVGRENLHQAAERILVQSAGVNMNTWIVGNVPIGHLIHEPRGERNGFKTFFMKGRIMAGQADLSKNLLGLEDYKWLTKEETRKLVSGKYWTWVKNMLADR